MRSTRLEITGPLPAAPMLGALAAHSLPGVQETSVASGTVRRVLELGGHDVLVEVRIADDDVSLRLPVAAPHEVTALATAAIRRWLDLDLDPAVVHEALGQDPRIGPLLAARPGLRIVGHPDPFEAAVTTVLGQRVSLAAARVLGARFTEFFADGGADGALRPFPQPAQVAAVDPVELRAAVGTTTARARSVVALAAACADGLDLTGPDHGQIRARLLALPGIGPWSVEYLAVRVLGDRDAYPSGDLVLQRALGVRSAVEADQIAAPWRPWRAYALFHLWTAESYDPAPRQEPTPP